MKRDRNRRAGARRWLARILAPIAVSAAVILGTSGVALANSGADFRHSGCQWAWNYLRYGADATAYEWYQTTQLSPTVMRLDDATAGVGSLIDCGPGGYTVTAYRLKVDFQLRFTGTNVSCSAGYPASFSCTVLNNQQIVYSYSTTCSSVSKCEYKSGRQYFYAPSGGSFLGDSMMQTTVTLTRNDGNAFTWGTLGV